MCRAQESSKVIRAALILLLLAQPAAAVELYLQTGLGLQFRHGPCDRPICDWDRNRYAPALAHLELGIEQRAGRFTFGAFARHESLPTHHDFGVNQVGLQVRISLLGKQ